tara:strand:- start:1011 stop:1481 length:471 start_codon:yes stop_codon:yes gene_type:complete
MIRRLEAQRACLAAATEKVGALPGSFLELGLGNGRTYDHLRELAPDREIFVFERNPAAHPACTPSDEFLIEGDFTTTLGQKKGQLEASAILAHCDIGSGVKERDLELARAISTDLDALLCDGAVVISDQVFDRKNWRPLSVPTTVEPGRYFMYLKV